MDTDKIDAFSKEMLVGKHLYNVRSTQELAESDDVAVTSALIKEKEGHQTLRELGQADYQLAKIFYDKADLVNAESYLLQALDRCDLPGDGFAMLKIAGFLIRIYSESLRKEEAKNFIDMSQMILDVLFSSVDSGRAEYFFYLGMTQMYAGKFKESIQSFAIAKQKAQEQNEPELVAKSLHSMAQNNFHVQEYGNALICLDQLDQLLSILNKGYLKGSMYILKGNILNETGKYEEAIANFQKSLQELNKKLCWNLHGYIMLGMGRSYKKQGNYKKAILFFEMAMNSSNSQYFKRLNEKVTAEVYEVQDSDVDFYIDKQNRLVKEKNIGVIDFKHRFVLLEILFLLASKPGRYYDKEDLSREIWKEEYNPLIHDKIIYTSISRLRKLIETAGEKNKYIIRGKDGYTFSPHVKIRFCQSDSQTSAIGNIEISSPI